MKNETHTNYVLTWESDTQPPPPKQAHFALLEIAETWYDEKLAEGKNPRLWKAVTTVTFEEMRPQEDNS